jgi:DNA-binding transcriptional MerR regulator
LKIAKERLHLPEKLILRFSEKGLSYKEMRAILTLPKKQRYSDMTTDQLLTLRDKVLLRFQKEVDNHIYSWKKLEKQILLVAREKGIDLNG